MKPHLTLHVTRHQKAWWVGFSYPWDKYYSVASTMNFSDPRQAVTAARGMCAHMQGDIDNRNQWGHTV